MSVICELRVYRDEYEKGTVKKTPPYMCKIIPKSQWSAKILCRHNSYLSWWKITQRHKKDMPFKTDSEYKLIVNISKQSLEQQITPDLSPTGTKDA